jgi:hypothetical protein
MSASHAETSPAPLFRATFAVIGDPHFVLDSLDPAKAGSSHIRVGTFGELLRVNGSLNPWADLIRLVQDQSIAADALLCAGDLCVAGDPNSLAAAWRHLNDLRASLAAKDLFATTGNHDVRSRSAAQTVAQNPIRNLSMNFGPFERLKVLEPPYPVVRSETLGDASLSRQYRTKYFGDGLVLVTGEAYRVLSINSCAEHTADAASNERGTFPESAERALAIELAACTEPRINVAILHHPPEIHSRYSAGAHDFVEHGEALIQQLSTHGHWLVIHGHKHDGRIRYASGSGRPPVIFAAASLGAHLPTNLPGQRNQFYLLDVELTRSRELRGVVKAWNWNAGAGWRQAVSEDDGIFVGCGFGCRDTPERIAQRIVDCIAMQGLSLPCDWQAILNGVEDVQYLTPESLTMTLTTLRESHGILVERDSSGRLFQLSTFA